MREASDDDGAFHDVTGPAGRRTPTGLADGQHIFDTIFAEARRPEPIRAGQLMAVMVIEIDDAEAGAGGDALTAVGDRIRTCLRPDDAAAMLGGHQFLALLRDVPDVSTARATAQRIIDLLAHPDQFHDSTTGIRATIGLSVTDARSEVTSLFRQADTALSAAKVRGDGRWLQYHEGMSVPTGVLVEARRVLDAAFHERRLSLVYQPVIALATGALAGFEALLRYNVDTTLSTSDLIAAAESTGLIDDVGDWVMRQALADLEKLSPPGLVEPRFVSVNVSPHQLQDPEFAEMVRSLLARHGADPHNLVLEITESVLVDDEHAWATLAELRRIGARVAIDDYGSGYATLSYLRRTSIDVIKIDNSFLLDIESPRTQTLIEAVIRLARNLGIDHIAEGVDSEAARKVLLDLGCQYGQGFHLARPMPIDVAAAWSPAMPTARSSSPEG